MKVFGYLVVGMCVVSCSARVVQQNDQLVTLESPTGTLNLAKEGYSFAFEKKAKELCGDKGYDLVEKSSQPSTLSSCKGLLQDSNFYWVIRCR